MINFEVDIIRINLRNNLLNYGEILFENSLESIIITDIYGVIKDVNPQGEQLLKRKKIDLVNSNFSNYLQRREDMQAILSQISEHSILKKFHTELKQKHSTQFHIVINATLYQEPNSGVTFMILFIEDITAQKLYEIELISTIESLKISREIAEEYSSNVIELMEKIENSQIELRELNASKDKFFSIIAHDLKGPLSGTTALLDLVLKDLDNLSVDEFKEYFILVHEYITGTYKLLENLLSWARLQRGNMPNNPDLFSMHFAIDNSVELLKGNATQKEITLNVEIPEDLMCYADSNMVFTIVRNLLSNAIKFTPIGGTIKIFAHLLDDARIICGVQDNGVGMSIEVQEKLFNVGTHYTTLGTKNEKGTGLGLILCKELVEKSGGQIWVESEEGVGTSFNFTLPAHAPKKLNTPPN